MEGSESSMNRIGRTIWTVWGFLTGAVGRYLRPNEGDQNVNQEDMVTRSYKELKEKEEEKEKAWSQSEKPQSGVHVRTAAVQWEKGAVRSEHASKPTRSGVAWNTEVQEGRSEDVDKKGRERRDREETRDARDAVADVEQVRPPASTDGSQDFGVSGTTEEDVDVRNRENEDLVTSESTEKVTEAVNESEDLEEQTSEHGFGDSSEVLVEKVTEATDDLDKSEDNVDDLVSQLTCSSRERGDLLNKELKAEELTENKASPTPEEEVIDANNVATKQETVGTVKNGQHEVGQQLTEFAEVAETVESKLDEDYTEFNEGIVETECELLEEPVSAPVTENAETSKKEPEPFTRLIEDQTPPTSGRDEIDNTEGREAGQQFKESEAAESCGICHSNLDESKLLEKAVTAQVENVEVYEEEPTPEGDVIDAVSDETADQQEAGQQLRESMVSEIPDRLDIHESMVETQFEGRVEDKCEPLEKPVAEQEPKEPEPVSKTTENRISSSQEGEPIDSIEDLEARQQFRESKAAEIVDVSESQLDEDHTEFAEAIVETKLKHLEEPVAEQEPKEPEPVSKTTENRISSSQEGEPIDSIEDLEARQQFRESKAAEIVDVSESQLDEDHTEFAEAIVETKLKHLEEPVAEQEPKEPEPASKTTENRISSSQEEEPIDNMKDLEARQQFSESTAAEIVDVCESQLDEGHTEFAEAVVETKLKHLEEPVAEQEPKEPEPVSKTTENRISSSQEGEPIDSIEDLEARQQFRESKAAEIVDVCESQLDEDHTEFAEAIIETNLKHLEEPVTGQTDIAEISEEPESLSGITEKKVPEEEAIFEDSKQRTVGTANEEAGQRSVDPKTAESFDICRLKLDEAQFEFTGEVVETRHGPLKDPVAEQEPKEPEPVSKTTENRISSSQEGEPIESTEDLEARQQFSESTAAETVDVCESQLDKDHVEFAEAEVETKLEHLEEGQTSEIEPEPLSKITEKKVPDEEAIFEDSKQGTVGTAKDEAEQQSVDSKTAESFDICPSKQDEAQFEFTGEVVETRHEHLEEPVAEQIEVHETEPEPFSKVVENRASPTPEREMLDAISEETKQVDAGQQLDESKAAESKLDEDGSEFREETVETACELLEDLEPGMGLEPISEPTEVKGAPSLKREVIEEAKLETKGTVQDGQLEAGQLLSESKDAEIVNVCESKLDEAQYTEEAVMAEGKLLEEMEQMYEQHGDGVAKDMLAEMVLKQDNESVDTGPGNQTETLETTSNFQQEVREEVVVDDMKKSAERSSQAQPVAEEALALQEAMDQSSLKQEPKQEKSAEENVSDEFGLLKAPAKQEGDNLVNMPSSSPQEPEDSLVACVELLVEAKTVCTEHKVEALERHVESTAESDQAATEVKCEHAESEMDAITESESSPAAAETSDVLKTSAEASDLDVGQIPLGHGSTIETHGVQIEYSGALSLPESEPVDQTSEIQRNMQKDTEDALEVLEMQRNPQKRVDVDRSNEAKIRLQDEIKTMTASSGVVEELMSGLSQDLQERQSLSSIEPHDQTKPKQKGKFLSEAFESYVEPSESKRATLQTCANTEERKPLQVETMDLVDDEEAETDSNANVQRRSRPALKRGLNKITRDEKDEPSKLRSWAATDLLLQQVSSLDCTVQKSKIAVKNPLVRPPKDPRTLINMASVEPLAPARPSKPGPLRTGHGEALPVPQKVIGFKLPGLGAGFPVLRKTDAGRKMRDEGETESESTQNQTSDEPTKPKEDCVKPEQPVSKPKWTPPRHPGMGGPLMMSELKSKLKKPGKD